MIQKQIFFPLMIISLLCSCAGKTDSEKFHPAATSMVVCDESKVLLRSLPRPALMVDDSTLATITNRSQLSWYNILTGKNTDNFALADLSIDSLLDKTYNIKYSGNKHYNYDAAESGGLNNAKFLMCDLAIDQDNYYLHINCEAEVQYIHDDKKLKSKLPDPNLPEIQQKNSDAEFHFMEYVEFLIILNKDHSFNRIMPLYRRAALGKGFPSFQLGFAAFKGSLYVPLAINFSAKSYRKPFGSENSFYSFCKLDIADTTSAKLILGSKEMDYSELTLNRYLERRSFQSADDGLYICNGKDIINVSTSQKIKVKEMLAANEWITNFYIDKEKLILRTWTLLPKAHPNKMELAYGIDSIAGRNLVAIDRKTGAKQQFPIMVTEIGAGAISRNELIYFERDKENYYITRIKLNEK